MQFTPEAAKEEKRKGRGGLLFAFFAELALRILREPFPKCKSLS
jgi:hypothetical protein